MAIELTNRALEASKAEELRPNLVLEINGVTTVFGAVRLSKLLQYGDPVVYGGANLVYGGVTELPDQDDLINLDGTDSTISQQLLPDQGAIGSISSLNINLVDENEKISDLISPGNVVTDLLGERAKVYLGFFGTAFPEDYVEVLNGIIDDISSGPGNINLNVIHPDKKKNKRIFTKRLDALDSGITDSVTTIPVTDANTIFEAPFVGPNGSTDPAIKHYVRINDEIIQFTGLTA